MNIVHYIPNSKEYAVTRDELSDITNLSDRDVRQLIENARRDGALIINLSGRAGYWISSDPAEIAQYVRQEENRLKSIGARLKASRRFLKSESAQTTANS